MLLIPNMLKLLLMKSTEVYYLLAELQQKTEGRITCTKPKKNYKGTDSSYLLEHDNYANIEIALNRVLISLNKLILL